MRDWMFTAHAVKRIEELHFTPEEVAEALLRPEVAYTQDDYPDGRMMHQAGPCALVVSHRDKVVVTALLRSQTVWEHGTHTAKEQQRP